MALRDDLLSEWDSAITRGFEAVADKYVDLVQAHPSTPRKDGDLAAGIKRVSTTGTPATGVLSTDVNSTARTDAGADYGTILDQSTGKLVNASDKGHRAFGPIRPPVRTSSGRSTEFLGAFRVTTKHVGWWDAVNSLSTFNSAVPELARYDL